ncbi:MAG: hypothetical protein ACREBU_06360 [Nitrososphaera sp.]
MKLPKINLKELEKIKKQNFKERLEFQDRYVQWMKMTNNIKWSEAQKSIINRESTDTIKRSSHNRSAARARYARRRLRN